MTTLAKTSADIEQERLLVQSERLAWYAGKSLEKAFPRAIKDVFETREIFNAAMIGRKTSERSGALIEVYQAHGRFLSDLVLIARRPEGLENRKLLEHLYDSNCFTLIEKEEHWTAIKRILEMSLFWIREPRDWKRPSRNPYKQMASLLRFLFCRYPVPSFLDSAFTHARSESKFLDWFINLGQGRNLKSDITFPQWMTKRMLHAFQNAPEDFTIPQALRYGQVVGLGGDERLALAIDATRIPLDGEELTLAMVKFFADAPMLDPAQIGTMVDYLLFLRTQTKGKFTMKGRTVDAVYRDSEEWHYYTERARRQQEITMAKQARATGGGGRGFAAFKHYSWKPWDEVRPFNLTVKQDNKVKYVYSITQISTSRLLQEEGAEMSHCVFSYHKSCADGTTSIWSFKINSVRTLTIEVRCKSYQIVQIRGHRNRMADASERRIIEKWAVQEKLEFGRK